MFTKIKTNLLQTLLFFRRLVDAVLREAKSGHVDKIGDMVIELNPIIGEYEKAIRDYIPNRINILNVWGFLNQPDRLKNARIQLDAYCVKFGVDFNTNTEVE